MALSDPLVPDNTFDPIPRGRVVDIRTGALTPGWRNWHESKGRQLGEIISGVDRNSENIVQLETDYTAADGVVTSAYISADAVVASDAESARATLSTTLTAAYQAADVVIENSANTYTDAEISTEQTVRAAADAAEASARTSLQATLESADATLQSNIDSEASTRATADSTAATDRTTIRSEFAAADTAVASAANTYTDAEITTEAATRAAADTAEATARETLEASIAERSAFSATNFFGFDNSDDGWDRRTAAGNADATNSTFWTITAGGSNAVFTFYDLSAAGINLPSEDLLILRARVRRTDASPSSNWTGRCYYQNESHGYSASYYLDVDAPSAAQNEWFVVEWDMSSLTVGGSDYINSTDIQGIRFDLFWSVDAVYDIDWAAFGTRDAAASQASLVTEQTARVAADTAEATARETLEVRRVQMLPGSLLTNPRFDYPSTSPGVPYGWSNWGAGTLAVLADKPSSLPGQCCQQAALVADTSQGFYQDANEIEPSRNYLVCAEIVRGSDYLHRSGVLVQWFNSSSGYLSDARISFATDENTNGEVSTVHDGVVRFEKIITSPANAAFARVYAMNSWVTFSASSSTPNIYWLECDLKPVSITDARTEILREAFIDSDGTAYAQLSLTAATGSDPARLTIKDGAGGSNIALDADEVFFGSDTVFEDTHDTFYTEANSYRYRDRGPFGSSGDLLQWYGPTSVSLNSETKTNGIWSMATDGKIRLGSNVTSGLKVTGPSVAYEDGTSTSKTFGSVTATATGGSSYTYSWAQVAGSTSKWTSGATTNASITVTINSADDGDNLSTWRCTVTETGSGDTATVDVGFNYYKI